MMLNLTQEFTILLLDERKGKLQAWTQPALPWAIPAALLDDLLLAGQIWQNAQGQVIGVRNQLLHDPLLDGVVEQIAQAAEPRTLKSLIGVLNLRWMEYLDQSVRSLVSMGVLVSQQKRHPWSHSETVYTLSDTKAPYWIALRLRAVIFSAEPADAQTNALLALLKESRLVGLIAGKEELRQAYHLAGLLVESNAVSRVAGELLSEHSRSNRFAAPAGSFHLLHY